MKRISLKGIIILIAGAVWIWISAALPGSTSNSHIPVPREGFLAPDFSLQTTGGETITLSELRGQPVLIHVWASWCLPCRAEMPAIQRLYDEYRENGFLVLAVNTTSQDDPQAAAAFVEEHKLTFPILLDIEWVVSTLYNVNALPTSFFVDRDGIIQEVVVGGPMAGASLQDRIEKLTGKAP